MPPAHGCPSKSIRMVLSNHPSACAGLHRGPLGLRASADRGSWTRQCGHVPLLCAPAALVALEPGSATTHRRRSLSLGGCWRWREGSQRAGYLPPVRLGRRGRVAHNCQIAPPLPHQATRPLWGRFVFWPYEIASARVTTSVRLICQKRFAPGARPAAIPGRARMAPEQRRFAGRAILSDLHVQPVWPIASTLEVFLK